MSISVSRAESPMLREMLGGVSRAKIAFSVSSSPSTLRRKILDEDDPKFDTSN